MKNKRIERLFVRLLISKKYDVSVKKKRKSPKRSSNRNSSEKKDSCEEEIEMEKTAATSSSSKMECNKKMVKKATREVFDEFCSQTTIHGVKYLNEASWRSRIVWLLIYAFSLWFCGFLVFERYERWEKNPVIISFDKKFESIAEVPFPAVTICPETKTDKKLYNYTRVLSIISNYNQDNRTIEYFRLTDEEKEAFQVLAQMCLSKGADVSKILLHPTPPLVSDQIFSILERVAPPLYDVCSDYDWAFSKSSKKCNSTRDFGRIITEDGMCYTFNMLDKSELFRNHTVVGYKSNKRFATNWSKTSGYTKNITEKAYPKRVFSTREKLVINLKLQSSNYDTPFPAEGRGFKIYIHSPMEFPWSTKQYFRVSPAQSVTLTVTPQLIRTSSQLKNYLPERRECYFNAENPLKYFQVYTKENCELECLGEYSKMLCDCIPYWMPRQNDTKICGLANFECYTLAVYKHLSDALNIGDDEDYNEESLVSTNKTTNSTAASNHSSDATTARKLSRLYDRRYFTFLSSGRQRDADDDDITKKYDNIGINFKCKCLPACNSINYLADYRTSALYFDNYSALPLGYQFLRLEVQFRESQFVPMRRSELYSLYDFVSNFGGLFGLFLGMSLMSLFEVVYFFTIKLTSAISSRLRKSNIERSREREVAKND